MDRKQPTVMDVNEVGEMVWGFIPMPRWQMEMVRLTPDYLSNLFTRWIELKDWESAGEEFSREGDMLTTLRGESKERLLEMKRMYPSKRKLRGEL